MKFRNPSNNTKTSKKSLYITLFIILLMVSSVIGFVIFTGQDNSSNKTGLEYNGYEFTNVGNGWITKINGNEVYFDYLPSEVSSITYDKSKLSITSKVYVTYDPSRNDKNMDFVLAKIDQSIKSLGYSTNLACINGKNCPDVPIVNCVDNQNVLYLKFGPSNSIYKDNGCIVIEGKDIVEISKASDNFIYSISGVI